MKGILLYDEFAAALYHEATDERRESVAEVQLAARQGVEQWRA
jgi:hypothetical protein